MEPSFHSILGLGYMVLLMFCFASAIDQDNSNLEDASFSSSDESEIDDILNENEFKDSDSMSEDETVSDDDDDDHCALKEPTRDRTDLKDFEKFSRKGIVRNRRKIFPKRPIGNRIKILFVPVKFTWSEPGNWRDKEFIKNTVYTQPDDWRQWRRSSGISQRVPGTFKEAVRVSSMGIYELAGNPDENILDVVEIDVDKKHCKPTKRTSGCGKIKCKHYGLNRKVWEKLQKIKDLHLEYYHGFVYIEPCEGSGIWGGHATYSGLGRGDNAVIVTNFYSNYRTYIHELGHLLGGNHATTDFNLDGKPDVGRRGQKDEYADAAAGLGYGKVYGVAHKDNFGWLPSKSLVMRDWDSSSREFQKMRNNGKGELEIEAVISAYTESYDPSHQYAIRIKLPNYIRTERFTYFDADPKVVDDTSMYLYVSYMGRTELLPQMMSDLPKKGYENMVFVHALPFSVRNMERRKDPNYAGFSYNLAKVKMYNKVWRGWSGKLTSVKGDKYTISFSAKQLEGNQVKVKFTLEYGHEKPDDSLPDF